MSEEIKISRSLETYNRLSLDLEETYGSIARYFGISDSTLMIFYTLLVCQHVSQAEITRLCGLPKQTINSALKHMEEDELLELVQAKGRRKEIVLTEKGRKLAEDTAGRVIQAEQKAFEQMPEKERTEFLRLSDLYQSKLRQEMEEIKHGNQTV